MRTDAGSRVGRWGWSGAWVLTGFVAGLGLHAGVARIHTPLMQRDSVSLGRLTSPYLECRGEADGDSRLVAARSAILRYVQRKEDTDKTLRVSVFARDLNNGPWIGIDENEKYVPASLSKVPIMLYVLARAERDPSTLHRSFTFPGADAMKDEDSMAGAPDEMRMEQGQTYTTEDLLFRMIAYSDNYAKDLLMAGTSEADVDALMHTIGANQSVVDGQAMVDPVTYSLLFRALYNATFVGRPLSEYALGVLSEDHFEAGIRHYLPEDVTVAAKWGYFEGADSGGLEEQVHDCGIVYRPGAPYVLCVMTRSRQANADQLADVIANVSRLVWQKATAQ